jgi:hypothetical protein
MSKEEQVAKIARALVRETAANIADYADREEEFRQRFEALVAVQQEAQPVQRFGASAHGVDAVQQVVNALAADVKKRDEKVFINLMQYSVDVDAILLAIVNDLLTDLCWAQGWGGLSTQERKALPRIEAILFGHPG